MTGTTTDLATAELGRAMAKLQKRKPNASLREIARWGIREYDLDVTHETVRRTLQGGADPRRCGLDVLLLLMRFYDAEPEDMGNFAARRIRAVMAMSTPTPDGTRRVIGESSSACTSRPLVDRHLHVVTALAS